jgi:hypothetical protein
MQSYRVEVTPFRIPAALLQVMPSGSQAMGRGKEALQERQITS